MTPIDEGMESRGRLKPCGSGLFTKQRDQGVLKSRQARRIDEPDSDR